MLNLDARPWGSVTVDILDAQGQPLPGFSGDDAVPATGSAVRTPMTWRARAEVTELDGRVVRFRFRLKKASLYAFWTE